MKKFSDILNNLNHVNHSELTDSKYRISSQNIKGILTNLETKFSNCNLDLDNCLYLQIDNTLLSAIFLLYLFYQKYTFFLTSKDEEILPNFCKYKIIPQLNSNSLVDLDFEIIKNNSWNGFKADLINPKLFLQTSGSTGEPKLVVHSHNKLWQNIFNCQETLGLKSGDRLSIPVPIYHLFGLGAAFLPGIIAGASIDLQQNSNLLIFLEREKKFNPNIAFMTPSFAQTLLKARKSPRFYDFTVIAGDRISVDTFINYEEKFGTIVPLYGSTEMGVMAIANVNQSIKTRQNTVGKPLTGVELKLENTEKISQLLCRHQNGFEGYIDNNGNWLYQLKEDWFATKDLAEIDEEGYLKILGRSDFSVNRDGLLVLLTDIEKAIETIAGVEKAIAIVTGENIRGKEINVYCVLQKNAQLTTTEIRKFCFNLLPRRAIPDKIIIISNLPLLANGKIDRQKLI